MSFCSYSIPCVRIQRDSNGQKQSEEKSEALRQANSQRLFDCCPGQVKPPVHIQGGGRRKSLWAHGMNFMGSSIIQNDSLQITSEQGFPSELILEEHLKQPYKLEDFVEKVFSFHGKPAIRNYQQPPVRNFLIENNEGKWVYWGLVHVLSITHDYINKTTSGTFKIIYLNSPEEMRKAFELIDRNPDTDFFASV